MATTSEVMGSIQGKGGICQNDQTVFEMEKCQARDVPRVLYFKKRKVDGSIVRYEVRCKGGNKILVQLWWGKPLSKKLLKVVNEIAKVHAFEIGDVQAALGVHGGSPITCDGKSVEDAVSLIRTQLERLENAFGEFIEKETKKFSEGRMGGVHKDEKRMRRSNEISAAPNTVTFDPYVGESYGVDEETKFKKRILVVGASHYCSYYKRETGCSPKCKYYGRKNVGNGRYCGEKCQLLSSAVIKAYCESDRCVDDNGNVNSGWKRTFTKFTNAFIEKRSSGSRIHVNSDVFKHLVDVEYVQGVEGVAHNDTNRALFSDGRNFEELKKTIREMKSEVVVLWGPRVINEVYGRFGKSGSTKNIEEIDFEGRMITLVACRTHPASNDWNADDLRKLLMQVGVCLLEAD